MSHDQAHRREEIHVHLHIDGPINLTVKEARETGVGIKLAIGGNNMAATSLSIDDTTGTAAVAWVDDKGDTDAAAPEGVSVTFAVEDPSIATIDANGALTLLKEGSTNVSATPTNADGTPASQFPTATAALTVVAGAAVGEELTIKP